MKNITEIVHMAAKDGFLAFSYGMSSKLKAQRATVISWLIEYAYNNGLELKKEEFDEVCNKIIEKID